MDDGKTANTKDEKIGTTPLAGSCIERPTKSTINGHDLINEPPSPPEQQHTLYRHTIDNYQDDKVRKRINPLRIHLGKRPFVDNSIQYGSAFKKKKNLLNKSDPNILSRNTGPRVPKLIPKRVNRPSFHNITSQPDNSALAVDNEKDKPVPMLVLKSQLQQYKQLKKGKSEKAPLLKEYAQSLGLQPMVKFKCRKCCSMSFKTLAMLKEHQLVCKAQAKEPALSPEAAPQPENTSGPSRVTRKVYLCSVCGTYYENWNLFLHMREVHNRYICLFCLGMFSKAEKLSLHLANKHSVKECNYNSKEEFSTAYNGTLYLMCCVCEEICSEQDDFFNHDCNNIKPKPVPVLVSKNSAKCNVKQNKNNISSTNGPHYNVKDGLTHIDDTKNEKNGNKSPLLEINSCTIMKENQDENPTEPAITNISLESESSENTNKNISTSNVSEYSTCNINLTSPHSDKPNQILAIDKITNGNEKIEHTNGKYHPNVADIPVISETVANEVPLSTPIEKEKEGALKLKLSLNNVNSPVIINSTVDPSIGLQKIHKPPPRVRRPPKRYEKEIKPGLVAQPKTPSIKMTICDKPDSTFVKTTIYENFEDKPPMLNNNLDMSTTSDIKVDNTIKSTIYDNKMEEIDTLNRVPKLTVRVPKELLDKDSSSDYSSDSDVSDKLTVDEHNVPVKEENEIKQEDLITESENSQTLPVNEAKTEELFANELEKSNNENSIIDSKLEPKTEPTEDIDVEHKSEEHVSDELPVIELTLDKPIDKYPLKDLLKVFLASTIYNCIYCNHVRKIAVNCEQLALHMVVQHRFSATVNSITAEELMPETIVLKVRTSAEELRTVFINLDSYDSVDKCETVEFDHLFECFQCYFKTAIHKDLYLHNRKMHQKTILLCVMCKSNFYSYSELLCHLCPGTYDSEYDIKYRCCLCTVDSIPSSFRLMVHLRKIHHTCDVCLEFCYSQARLSNHVWKHKLHHLCYRCGIAYRNKADITKHLFWKHGTESVLCKKCLQKKWPHVYHFCSPPAIFVCEECSLEFTRAVCLKVHKRFHLGEYPHVCTEVDCSEKFVSKKLLSKHIEEHKKKLFIEDMNVNKPALEQTPIETPKEIPVIDLVDSEILPKEAGSSDVKVEGQSEQVSKKAKKKKLKDKDSLLLDVNLPELNLSESDSSDDSDGGTKEQATQKEQVKEELNEKSLLPTITQTINDEEFQVTKLPEPNKIERIDDEKANEQKVLDIWDNFQKYQATVEAEVEKPKAKTPPLVPIRRHVCESDHDYCLVPVDMNGDEGMNTEKKKNKKSLKKKHGGLSSSSSSSSDSDSSCSCGSNCSCSSSSGSSSSSSSGSDSSDESGNEKKKNRKLKKAMPDRRISNGSNVDVMGNAETPILIPEKLEPLIAETDLETDESETDEEFFDEHPQQLANKLHAEKRNQLMLLASVAPSDGGSISGDVSRCATPIKEEVKTEPEECKLPISSKKKSKKKKKSRSSKKRGPIKINIPKDIIGNADKVEEAHLPLVPNKITISLQSNTVQLPEISHPPKTATSTGTPTIAGNKRASKRKRVRNKFYGYSSDEDTSPSATTMKPHQPPKLEWRKEDLPTPVTHRVKKEVPSSTIPSRIFNYSEPLRLVAPVPDPEPPKILMESSDSDSSDEGALEIYQPNSSQQPPLPPPSYLNSGTSSLPYPFERRPVREAREGESVYCYCRCPYDEFSEMIGCDAEGCPIEWFHFECVGIMVPPKGKWYCPECRKNQSFSGYR